MMRKLVFIAVIWFPVLATAQKEGAMFTTKTLAVSDSIPVDSVSINPDGFKVFDLRGKRIPQSAYQVNYAESVLFPGDSLQKNTDSLRVRYKPYPKFLTKSYFQFDPGRIVKNMHHRKGLYQLGKSHRKTNYKPFNGLNTNGSISRGITAGTNQNSV